MTQYTAFTKQQYVENDQTVEIVDEIKGINIVPYLCSEWSGDYSFIDNDTKLPYTTGDGLRDYIDGVIDDKNIRLIVDATSIPVPVGNIYFPINHYENNFKYRRNYLDGWLADYTSTDFILTAIDYIDYTSLPTIVISQVSNDGTDVKIGSTILFEYDGTNEFAVANVASVEPFYNTSNVDYFLAYVYDSTILQVDSAQYTGTYDQTAIFTRTLPNTYDYTSIDIKLNGPDLLIILNDYIHVLYKDGTTYITVGQAGTTYQVIHFIDSYYILEDLSLVLPVLNTFKFKNNVPYDFEKEIFYKEIIGNEVATYIKDIRYSNCFRFKVFDDTSQFTWTHNDDPVFNFVYSPTYSLFMEVEDGTNVVISKLSKIVIDSDWQNLSSGMILLTSDFGYELSYTEDDNATPKPLQSVTLIRGKKINNTYYRKIT